MPTSSTTRSRKLRFAHSNVWVAIGSGIPVVAYLIYVAHFSVNVPHDDDWFIIPFVDAAKHGHLTISALWSQYGDRRLFLGRLIFIAFGFADHLNEKTVILFNAVVFVVSYVLLLHLFRLPTLCASSGPFHASSSGPCGSVSLTCRMPCGVSNCPGTSQYFSSLR